MRAKIPEYVLACCYRFQCLAIAVMRNGEVMEVRRHRVDKQENRQTFIAKMISRAALDYSAKTIILESDSIQLARTKAKTVLFSICEAKQALLKGSDNLTHEELFKRLVKDNPQLKRFVTIFTGTNNIKLSDRRQTLMLLTIALGLAAHQLSASKKQDK